MIVRLPAPLQVAVAPTRALLPLLLAFLAGCPAAAPPPGPLGPAAQESYDWLGFAHAAQEYEVREEAEQRVTACRVEVRDLGGGRFCRSSYVGRSSGRPQLVEHLRLDVSGALLCDARDVGSVHLPLVPPEVLLPAVPAALAAKEERMPICWTWSGLCGEVACRREGEMRWEGRGASGPGSEDQTSRPFSREGGDGRSPPLAEPDAQVLRISSVLSHGEAGALEATDRRERCESEYVRGIGLVRESRRFYREGGEQVVLIERLAP